MNSTQYLRLTLPVDVGALGGRLARVMGSLHRGLSEAAGTEIPVERLTFFLRVEAFYDEPEAIEAVA